jgi:hypothetical protein
MKGRGHIRLTADPPSVGRHEKSRSGLPGRRVLWTAVALVMTSQPLFAQRPHGTPPGLVKKGQHSSSSSSTSSAAGGGDAFAPPPVVGGEVLPGPAVRSFGVWLDDASVLGPREAWLTVSLQRWASPALRGFDVPVSDVSVGVVPQLQAAVSVPFTQYGPVGAPMSGQFGDVYAGVKYVVREPSDERIGMAVAPTIEVLSEAATDGTGLSRVNLVLPVNVEWRVSNGRVYGSTGYFTRGAVFAAGAYERTVTERWVATGALTLSRSTQPVETSTAWGLSRQRVDATGSASWIVTERLVVFGALARTLSQMDVDATRYAFSCGASFDLGSAGRSRPPIRP